MVTFLLISDIDKSSKSWYKWIPYNNSNTIFTSDFVIQLELLGKVYHPQPNFVNFRKYASYDNNKGYTNDIMFSIEDLQFENYSEWLYNQIDEEFRNNIIVIGLEQGCHVAKYFANRYHNRCSSVFILGDMVLTKQNYEKIYNDTYFKSLKKYFGKKWDSYKIENMNNTQLHEILTNIKLEDENKDNYVEFLNGYVKLSTRAQYNKINKTLVPMYIYTYGNRQVDEINLLHKEFIKQSKPIHVEYFYLEEDAPYFIFSKYKDEIIFKIKNINGMSGGATSYNKYRKYKARYLQLKDKIGGNMEKNKDTVLFLFFNGGGLTEKQWHTHPYKGTDNWLERKNENKTSNLISKIKKIGSVYLYTPPFYLSQQDIIDGKSFSMSDMDLVNHSKKLHKMINKYDRIFVISHSRGNILAQFFCELYQPQILGYINIDGGESKQWCNKKLVEWKQKYGDIDDDKLSELFNSTRKNESNQANTISRLVKYQIYKQFHESNYKFTNINMLILNNIYDDDETSISNEEYVMDTLKSKFAFNKQFKNDNKIKSIFYVGKTHYLYFYNDVVDDIIDYIHKIIDMK